MKKHEEIESEDARLHKRNISGAETKRRRMSKKERKALKSMNKQKRLKADSCKSTKACTIVNTNKTIDANAHVDYDVYAEEERIRLRCMKSYKAVDIPKEPSTDLIKRKTSKNTESIDTEGYRTLGKWFPNAIVMKTISYTNTGQLISNKQGQKAKERKELKDMTTPDPRSSLVLFYQYTTSTGDNNNDEIRAKKWNSRELELLVTYLAEIGRQRNIGGRIRVSTEGVNAT